MYILLYCYTRMYSMCPPTDAVINEALPFYVSPPQIQ